MHRNCRAERHGCHADRSALQQRNLECTLPGVVEGGRAHLLLRGEPYELDSFTRGVTIPVQPLRGFFPFLVDLNKQVEPDCSMSVISPKPPKKVLRLTSENPLDAVLARLQQFTSPTLARKLVERRAESRIRITVD